MRNRPNVSFFWCRKNVYIPCIILVCFVLTLPTLIGGVSDRTNDLGSLYHLNDHLEKLASRISPSVVEIFVWGYGYVNPAAEIDSPVAGKTRGGGSGVILNSNGYIITNAHVLQNARRVKVLISQSSSEDTDLTQQNSLNNNRFVDAEIVGIDNLTDLALIKIDVDGLSPIPFADYQGLRQGQLVMAFGNPFGLHNSVTLGVISSVARQLDPDDHMVYIQTDAAVNEGNSGGPLVDLEGNLVGLNTLTMPGDGIGLAIPGETIRFVLEELRSQGRVRRGKIGAYLQGITPYLSAGLSLPVENGVIISDLEPNGPADLAGLRIEDIVLSIDGTRVLGMPDLTSLLLTRPPGVQSRFRVLRGEEELFFEITFAERDERITRLTDSVDPRKDLIPSLGIYGLDIDEAKSHLFAGLRLQGGVLVIGDAAVTGDRQSDLHTGDVIHSINGRTVEGVAMLRSVLQALGPGDAVALQIERNGELFFHSFPIG